MNRKLIPILLLLILALAVPVLAQVSTNFDPNWHVLSGGGGPRASSHYQIDDVLGQWPDGRTSSARYQIDPGFWHAGREEEQKRLYLPVVSGKSVPHTTRLASSVRYRNGCLGAVCCNIRAQWSRPS